MLVSLQASPCRLWRQDNSHAGGGWRDEAADAHLAAAQQLLQQSIAAAVRQRSATAGMQASVAAAAAAAATSGLSAAGAVAAAVADLPGAGQQQQQSLPQGLRLRSFNSGLPRAVNMFVALQLRTLAHMDLNMEAARTDSAALSAAFVQLSSLRELHLTNMRATSLGSALTTLAKLSQLTLLKLSCWPTAQQQLPILPEVPSTQLAEPSAAALQQLLAQPLSLRELRLHMLRQLPVLDMSRLTKLTKLDTGCCQLPENSVLPVTLQQLEFHAWSSADSLAPVTKLQLKQLQHLSLSVDIQQHQPLLQLAQLPALQHLALLYVGHYSAGHAAVGTAAAWPLLPQLQELMLHADLPHEGDLTRIVESVTAATNLTKLDFNVIFEEPYGAELQVARFSSLSGLTRLQDLSFNISMRGLGYEVYETEVYATGDALALTALSSLTRLDVSNAMHGVGTKAATALASTLQQLQHLRLSDCGLELQTEEGMACLQAIGRLTQLTFLDLSVHRGPNLAWVTEQGLMQLTGLSRLQQLDVVCEDHPGVSDEKVMQKFWAAVRGH
jgi:hypothetical protein